MACQDRAYSCRTHAGCGGGQIHSCHGGGGRGVVAGPERSLAHANRSELAVYRPSMPQDRLASCSQAHGVPGPRVLMSVPRAPKPRIGARPVSTPPAPAPAHGVQPRARAHRPLDSDAHALSQAGHPLTRRGQRLLHGGHAVNARLMFSVRRAPAGAALAAAQRGRSVHTLHALHCRPVNDGRLSQHMP